MRRLLGKVGIAAVLIAGVVGWTATSASAFTWHQHKGFGGDSYSGPYCGFNSAYGFWDKASSWDNGGVIADAWDYGGTTGTYYWLWDMLRNSQDDWVGSADNDRADTYENYC